MKEVYKCQNLLPPELADIASIELASATCQLGGFFYESFDVGLTRQLQRQGMSDDLEAMQVLLARPKFTGAWECYVKLFTSDEVFLSWVVRRLVLRP